MEHEGKASTNRVGWRKETPIYVKGIVVWENKNVKSVYFVCE